MYIFNDCIFWCAICSYLLQEFPWVQADEESSLLKESIMIPLKSTTSGILKVGLLSFITRQVFLLLSDWFTISFKHVQPFEHIFHRIESRKKRMAYFDSIKMRFPITIKIPARWLARSYCQKEYRQ